MIRYIVFYVFSVFSLWATVAPEVSSETAGAMKIDDHYFIGSGQGTVARNEVTGFSVTRGGVSHRLTISGQVSGRSSVRTGWARDEENHVYTIELGDQLDGTGYFYKRRSQESERGCGPEVLKESLAEQDKLTDFIIFKYAKQRPAKLMVTADERVFHGGEEVNTRPFRANLKYIPLTMYFDVKSISNLTFLFSKSQVDAVTLLMSLSNDNLITLWRDCREGDHPEDLATLYFKLAERKREVWEDARSDRTKALAYKSIVVNVIASKIGKLEYYSVGEIAKCFAALWYHKFQDDREDQDDGEDSSPRSLALLKSARKLPNGEFCATGLLRVKMEMLRYCIYWKHGKYGDAFMTCLFLYAYLANLEETNKLRANNYLDVAESLYYFLNHRLKKIKASISGLSGKNLKVHYFYERGMREDQKRILDKYGQSIPYFLLAAGTGSWVSVGALLCTSLIPGVQVLGVGFIAVGAAIAGVGLGVDPAATSFSRLKNKVGKELQKARRQGACYHRPTFSDIILLLND